MDVYKIAVKVFATEDNFPPGYFVPILHRWIQAQSVEGHRLIDVADYGHVVGGPGSVLVSAEANFYMDRGENRLGILYSRKLPLPGSFQDRMRASIAEALKAADRLEREPLVHGKLKFKTDEILIRLNDRLLAPPSEETIANSREDVKAVAKGLFGESAVVEARFTPETLVEFRIVSRQSPALSDLLAAVTR